MTDPQLSSEDRDDVIDALYRYAQGLDFRDWDMFRALFAENIRLDFSDIDPSLNHEVSADSWVERAKLVSTGLAGVQHSMSNPRVFTAGDRVVCQMYMRAQHVFRTDDPSSWYTVGGYYTDTLERVADRWVITTIKHSILWTLGRPEILEEAREVGRRRLLELPDEAPASL